MYLTRLVFFYLHFTLLPLLLATVCFFIKNFKSNWCCAWERKGGLTNWMDIFLNFQFISDGSCGAMVEMKIGIRKIVSCWPACDMFIFYNNYLIQICFWLALKVSYIFEWIHIFHRVGNRSLFCYVRDSNPDLFKTMGERSGNGDI